MEARELFRFLGAKNVIFNLTYINNAFHYFVILSQVRVLIDQFKV